jgi:hypothetical protein
MYLIMSAFAEVFGLMSVIFSAVSYASPWWLLDYLTHCEEDVHLIVDLRFGLCSVQHTGGIQATDCVSWSDSSFFEAADSVTNTHTARDANEVIPAVNIMLTITLVACALILGVSILPKKYPDCSWYCQVGVAVMSITELIVAWLVLYLGARTDITRQSTWSPYNTCSDVLSHPFTSYYCLLCASICISFVAFVSITPEKLCCLHLVAFDNPSEDTHSISIHDVCTNPTRLFDAKTPSSVNYNDSGHTTATPYSSYAEKVSYENA